MYVLIIPMFWDTWLIVTLLWLVTNQTTFGLSLLLELPLDILFLVSIDLFSVFKVIVIVDAQEKKLRR